MQALNAGTQTIEQRPGRPSGSTLVGLLSDSKAIYLKTNVNESASRHPLINRVPRAPRLPGNLGRWDAE